MTTHNKASWLREPLVHFFALGAGLFLLYGWLNRDAFEAPDEIVVDDARVAALQAQFERTRRRPPTADELDGLVDNWIRDEIFYREGVALGFDQGDPVVRQRVVLKTRFMADSLVSDAFTAAELEAWFAENADFYRIDPRLSFRQVYFDPQRHGDGLADAVEQARRLLAESPDSVAGDATLLPASLQGASGSEIAATFGSDFAIALETLPLATWSGPVASPYGVHLVRVDDFAPARLPELAEVREQVERDLLARRTDEAEDTLYLALRERYTVRFAGDAGREQGAGGDRGP